MASTRRRSGWRRIQLTDSNHPWVLREGETVGHANKQHLKATAFISQQPDTGTSVGRRQGSGSAQAPALCVEGFVCNHSATCSPSGWRAFQTQLLQPEKQELCCCPRLGGLGGGTGLEERCICICIFKCFSLSFADLRTTLARMSAG